MAKPVRRGRPPARPTRTVAAAPVADAPKVDTPAPAESKSAVPTAVRRPRGSVGGFGAKLAAPVKEGFVRRFVNDDRNRVAQLTDLGYTMVDEPGIQSLDAGSVVSRLAGTKEGGAPLRTVLMETPVELYQQGRAEMEATNAVTDAAILSGRDEHGGLTDRETYQPRGHTNSIEVER